MEFLLGSEISTRNNFFVPGTNNALAAIEMPNPTTAIVKVTPTPSQQKNVTDSGVTEQFIAQYDVDRSNSDGEVLVRNLL